MRRVVATACIVGLALVASAAFAAPIGVVSQRLTIVADTSAAVTLPTPLVCTLRPVADTFVRSGLLAGSNFDASNLLRTGPSLLSLLIGDQRSLLRFDTAAACEESGVAVPTDATVVTAELELFLESAPLDPRTHELRRLTSAWEESTVTWNSQPPGTAVLTSTTTGTIAGVWREWTVTGDVRGFVGGTLTNHGWSLTDAAEGSILSAISVTDYCGRTGGATAVSGVAGATDRRPKLTIAYLTP